MQHPDVDAGRRLRAHGSGGWRPGVACSPTSYIPIIGCMHGTLVRAVQMMGEEEGEEGGKETGGEHDDG